MGLVGDAVRVGTYIDFFDAVVDADSNQAGFAGSNSRSQIIHMRDTKTILHTEFLLIDPYGRFDVRAFQEKSDSFSFPVGRYCNFLLIPGYPYIMFVGSQEKGKFHLPFYSVFLHVWIEIVRAVIQASGPPGAGGYFISFQLFGHGAGEVNLIIKAFFEPLFLGADIFPVYLEIPFTG